MRDPADKDCYIADLEQGGALDIFDDSALIIEMDKWGNEWDGIDFGDDVDIRLFGD